MEINWTPWFNVPTHRRLELFSVGFLIFCAMGILPISFAIFIYIMYCGSIYSRTICVLYLAFVYYDRHTGDRGGRGAGVPWIRGLPVWKYCLNYFPVNMVKTVNLPANKNYLLCFFPHGVLSFGASLQLSTSYSKWSTFFPGIRSKTATLAMNLLFPVSRELLLSLGICSASANSLSTLLTQSNDPNDDSNRDGYTSNAVGLIVGGAEESFYAHPNMYKCVLKNRKGFVKIALKTGASLVPAISFGENSIYDVKDYESGSWERILQMTFKRYLKFAPLLFNGRGYLQYNFGLLPKRHPITTVIGAPIHLEKHSKPSCEEIDKYHQLFCTQLNDLFETHKSKYVTNSENVFLEII